MSSDGTKPRILYLTKILPYPPAVAGDAVYSRGLIEALAPVAELTVVCGFSGADPTGAADGVDWRIVGPPRDGRARSMLSRWPLIAWKGAARDYRNVVETLLGQQNWDAIVLDNIGTAHALPRALAYRDTHPSCRLLYVSHEWEHPTRASKYESYGMNVVARGAAQLDLAKVKRAENALIRRCDIVTVINSADLRPFREIDGARKYLVVTPGYDGRMVEARQITVETPRRVLMLGGRKSEQKRRVLLEWLAAAYDDLVSAAIEICVAGEIDGALQQQISRQYPSVRVLGFVDDPGPLISSARAGIVADTVGGGFKLRLLTHVFHRLPIIGLDSAVDGLPTPAGEGYLTSDSLSGLRALICATIDDVDRLDAVQNRAFQDCVQEFSWAERASSMVRAITDPSDSTLS